MSILARRPPDGRQRIRLGSVVIGSIPLVVGAVSGLATREGLTGWYRTLSKPAWNPPDAVFGPVWTLLYAVMGVALTQVTSLDRARPEVRLALLLFALQLLLNAGWSWIFFNERAIGGALIEVVALLLAIGATIAAFARVRPSAAVLLVPYFAWTSFATALTADIWLRNR